MLTLSCRFFLVAVANRRCAGLLVHFMFTLPVAFLWLAGVFEPVLVALGQDPELSKQTSDYLARLAPGLLGHTLMFTLNPFCQSTGDSRSPFYASLVAAILHVPLNLLLLPRYGYLGAAAATSITQVSGPMMLYLIGESVQWCVKREATSCEAAIFAVLLSGLGFHRRPFLRA